MTMGNVITLVIRHILWSKRKNL